MPERTRQPRLNRRKLLACCGGGVGAAVLHGAIGPGHANAEGPSIAEQKRIVYVNLGGGWDTLMCFDPRSHQSFGDPGGPIYTGYDILADTDTITAGLIQGGGSGLIQPSGSNISFGPAIGNLASHYDKMCVLRGVSMGTLSHVVGRRYLLTGKFPSGLNASGSAIATVFASQNPDAAALPNLVMGGVETYNASGNPSASGVVVPTHNDLNVVLKSVNPMYTLDDTTQAALAEYIAGSDCLKEQLDVGGKVTAYGASWETSQTFLDGSLFEYFNFKPNPPPGSQMEKLYQAFGIGNLNQDLAGPKGQGMVAAQAIVSDVSVGVSIQPSRYLDDHDEDWEDLHLPALRDAFDIVASLTGYLASQPHSEGGNYLDHTIIMIGSEFARTPTINVRSGRDHHLANSCVLIGAGISGNQVIGVTTDDTYASQAVDFKTGQLDPNGVVMRPSDVHATVFEALGMPYDHLSNQDPQIIEKVLTG
jgi:uncharacterized protein (DUF1501 family)